MSRRTHPKQEIEDALLYAENYGWLVEVGGSHAWGKIYCPYNDKECRCGEFCIASIWSTPKNATNHAKQIKRIAAPERMNLLRNKPCKTMNLH